MLVSVRCRQCGKLFQIKPSQLQLNRGLFCSMACSGKSRRIPLLTRYCEWCGQSFQVYSSRRDSRFCSKKCARSQFPIGTEQMRSVNGREPAVYIWLPGPKGKPGWRLKAVVIAQELSGETNSKRAAHLLRFADGNQQNCTAGNVYLDVPKRRIVRTCSKCGKTTVVRRAHCYKTSLCGACSRRETSRKRRSNG